MRNILITSALYIAALSACKKERTCDCSSKELVTTVTSPRSGATASTSVQESTGTNAFTYSNMSKDDLKNYYDCNSKTSAVSNTGTTTILVTKTEAVNGFTFTNTKAEPADFSRTRVTTINCEIK